jgi:hypothetical protein
MLGCIRVWDFLHMDVVVFAMLKCGYRRDEGDDKSCEEERAG